MLMNLLMIFLSFCCFPSLLAKTELPVFFQGPAAILLSQVNSSAELSCSTTSTKATGLSLNQRYSKPRELLYVYLPTFLITIHEDFTERLSVRGPCCDITIRLSHLQTKDTDAYYCTWTTNEDQLVHDQADDTVIIVRDGDPKEACNKLRRIHHTLVMISMAIAVTMFIICIGVLIWRFRQPDQRYSPHKHHHRHQPPRCPHHNR